MSNGSSPLTRGKPSSTACPARQSRLIPAHAGKTPEPVPSPLPKPAHPRSRGENEMVYSSSRASAGSSPLTRGKPGARISGRSPVRLIPAHAGKTHLACACRSGPPAHPRSRGENSSRSGHAAIGRGSSPLTRGKRHWSRRWRDRYRLIPAHAGKTRPTPTVTRRCRAHPRSRGENQSCQTLGRSLLGSSPLTRGKRQACLYCPATSRLIPAHAGKTFCRGVLAGALSAHPRSRGENPYVVLESSLRHGSSPLTRGKHGRGAGSG